MKNLDVINNFLDLAQDYVTEYIDENYEKNEKDKLVSLVMKCIKSHLDELEDDATIEDCDLYIYEVLGDYNEEKSETSEKENSDAKYVMHNGKLNVKKSDFSDFNYKEIMKRYHSGNAYEKEKATEEMLANLENYIKHFVYSKYGSYTKHMEDLLQEARLAVVQHLDEYNPEITKPNTFFTCHIKGRVSHFIHLNDSNVSDHYGASINKIKKAQSQLQAEGLDPNDVNLLHQYTGIRETTIEKSLQAMIANSGQSINAYENPEMLDAQISKKSETPEKIFIENETKLILDSALSKLTDIERKCIEMYYYDDLDYTKIANRLKIDVPSVKKFINHGMYALKHNKEINQLQKISNSKKVEGTLIPLGAPSDLNKTKCSIKIVMENDDFEYENITEIIISDDED